MWYAVLFVISLIVLYMVTYLLNKKTVSPVNLSAMDQEKCGACTQYSCALKQRTVEEN